MTRVAFALLVMSTVAAANDRPPAGATAKLDRQIASVDRIPIWQSELDEVFVYTMTEPPAPDQLRYALDELIDKIIVQRAADRLHVTITDAEIDAAIDEIKQQNGLDDAGFDKALAEQHFTRAAYREEITRQLRAQKLYQLELAPKVTISEDEIKAAYAELKTNDPKTGAIDTVREQLRQALWATKLAGEQGKWLASQRKAAHIERRP